jgi:hypothetical protein
MRMGAGIMTDVKQLQLNPSCEMTLSSILAVNPHKKVVLNLLPSKKNVPHKKKNSL